MTAIIRQRFLEMLLTLLGITLISFFLFHISGGDPTLRLAGKHASAEDIHSLQVQLGTDQSLNVQYYQSLKRLLKLDFGQSWIRKESVGSLLVQHAKPTLLLTIPGFLLSLILSFFLGFLASFKKETWVDRTIVGVSFLFLSCSFLFFVLLFQYIFAFQLGWFPLLGWSYGGAGHWSSLALPILIFGAASFGPNTIFFRSLFSHEMEQPYPKTARAKGANDSLIFQRHVFRNTLSGILPLLASQIPFLILGSVILESFFAIPGLGRLLVDAYNDSDYPVIHGLTILCSVFYIMIQFVSEFLEHLIDPRRSSL